MKNEKEIGETNKDIEILNEETASKTKKKISKNIYSISNRFVHIKVGDKDRPASEAEITKIQENFDEYIKDNNIDCLVFVTHHAVNISVI